MANTAQVSMDGLMEINLNVREWDESIDDQTRSQIGQLLEDQSEIFDGISDLSLSQTQELYRFNLTPAAVDTDNVIDQLFSVKTEYKDERFGKFTDEDDIDNLVKSTESKNTRKNTSWSVKTFNEWRDARIASTGCTIPELINLTQPQEMNTSLSKFVVEAKRKDGQPYPPKSLCMLCVGLLRFMRECGIHENFLDEKDSKFYEFRRILSAKMSELTAQGIGTRTKQAEPVTTETEEELWNKGLLGNSSGKSPLNTMFYYNCKLFGLRGVDEHRQMEIDHVELGIDQQGHFVRFKGRVNKTYRGGIAHRHVDAKEIIHHFQNLKLYDMYQEYLGIVNVVIILLFIGDR